jgi:hypothetical protein
LRCRRAEKVEGRRGAETTGDLTCPILRLALASEPDVRPVLDDAKARRVADHAPQEIYQGCRRAGARRCWWAWGRKRCKGVTYRPITQLAHGPLRGHPVLVWLSPESRNRFRRPRYSPAFDGQGLPDLLGRGAVVEFSRK